MTWTSKKLLITATGAVLVVGILAGCANASTDLQPGTAAKLQDRLQSLSRSAAGKDIPAAKTELDLLAGDVSAAAANGELSAGRRQEIQNAVDLIRADLAAMTTAATPPPAPATAPAPALQSPVPAVPQLPGNGKGNGKEESHNTDD